MISEKKRTPKLPVLTVGLTTQDKETINQSLSGPGFEILFVNTCNKAFTLISDRTIPIIVVNHSPSEIDGFQFCRQIKKMPGKHSVVMILIAENKVLESVENLSNLIDDYLTKPLKKFEVRNRLAFARKTFFYTAARIKNQRQLKNVTDELKHSEKHIKKREEELRSFRESRYIHTGKLEALGRMASGIAHEINTPVQYVGDNIHFLKDSFQEMSHVMDSYKNLYKILQKKGDTESVMRTIDSLLIKHDLDYLEKEIPETISQSIEGLERISGIVLAMRNLSHPGSKNGDSVNINQAIKNTITLTRNEWKHVAEMKTDLARNFPDVLCHPGEFNQVILNMIINAAHAVSDSLKNSDQDKGIIEISTRKKGAVAEIRIHDTGSGIPAAIRDKIFEPFFTTKDAGKGTGQGLAISHSVITTYQGEINIESEPDKGTTFIITLPFCTQKRKEENLPNPFIKNKITGLKLQRSEKKRILFVDDDKDLLKALKRRLNPMKDQWEMTFTENGADALTHLGKKAYDVIVTDFRMSGMHGIDLLKKVKKSFPEVVRIMLSGETDQKLLMKAVRIVHQFIAKPCNTEELKATIFRTCLLNELLKDEPLRKTLSGIESLPSVPSLYTDITKEMNSGSASLKKAGEIISGDIAMTAKVLQLVNSAYFGLPSHISSPETAVIMLGLDTIQSLILHFELFAGFKIKKKFNPFLEDLKEHNLTTGTFAKKIAESLQLDRISADQAFMAGLLHDCGKLVLVANFPDQYDRVLDLAQKNNLSLEICEKDVFGITHAEAGAYLMGIWGLPAPIVEAIHLHHHPVKSMDTAVSPVTAVHLANVIHHEKTASYNNQATEGFDQEYLNTLKLKGQIDGWRALCLHDNAMASK